MSAYDIDPAAVTSIVNAAETELMPLRQVAAQVQATIDEVEDALSGSRVIPAFSEFADQTLMQDIESALTRTDNALRGTRQAVLEYALADYEMLATAQRAASGLPPAPAGAAGDVLATAPASVLFPRFGRISAAVPESAAGAPGAEPAGRGNSRGRSR